MITRAAVQIEKANFWTAMLNNNSNFLAGLFNSPKLKRLKLNKRVGIRKEMATALRTMLLKTRYQRVSRTALKLKTSYKMRTICNTLVWLRTVGISI